LSSALGLDRPHGALIAEVAKGGPADKAGLRTGDVIVRVGGTDVPHAQDLARIVANHAPGAHVPITVVRDKKEQTLDVTLDALKLEGSVEQKEPSGGQPGGRAAPNAPEIGAFVQDAPEGSGVVVQSVVPGGPADGVLERGDVITEIEHRPVAGAQDFERTLRATRPHQTLLLRTEREGHARYVAIERR
jgi:serine protease Do